MDVVLRAVRLHQVPGLGPYEGCSATAIRTRSANSTMPFYPLQLTVISVPTWP